MRSKLKLMRSFVTIIINVEQTNKIEYRKWVAEIRWYIVEIISQSD